MTAIGYALVGGNGTATERVRHASRAAGYDHVYLEQIGPDQAGFLRFAEGELLPALESDTLRLAS